MAQRACWAGGVGIEAKGRDIDDHVVERLDNGDGVEVVAPGGAYERIFRIDTLGRKKRDHQRRVILTIAEAPLQDGFGIVWNETAASKKDSDIGHVFRDPIEDGFHLDPRAFAACRDFPGELLNRWCNSEFGFGRLKERSADIVISLKRRELH